MSKDKGYERHNQIPDTKCLMAVDIKKNQELVPTAKRRVTARLFFFVNSVDCF